ncbi:uncharacterized protein LOC112567994 isoform X2 [Pomacea canaliculata]|uniref:uncharacterized protein LOC112567994 isoform X2 n=1 Tax=Pomacea canaliculata TaxID=400727 RepID=UPI000D7387DC|nr:uncharacterized protein LOC112567994 isoform X2 [Pomacea canaliculata]
MFRWLKDRKKGKKQAEGGVRSKEDDYGFKQGFPDMKRDLPPTPDVTSASSAATDDDRSVHIYEEIPDLPFRCTPEGELRIRLVRESDGGGVENCHLGSGSAGGATRDVSPYMVVPLERLMGTPLEFRPPRPELHGGSFAGAVVGHQRRYRAQCDGCSTSCTCEGSSEGTTTPSWDDSSVFSSTLGAAAGGGGSSAAGDISDRLLSAINLTRLLTAIRLSSSSADTLTTSPICIGMDKDGKNFSVSLNVTPVSHTTAINDDVDEDSNNNNNEHLTRGPDAGDAPGPGGSFPVPLSRVPCLRSCSCALKKLRSWTRPKSMPSSPSYVQTPRGNTTTITTITTTTVILSYTATFSSMTRSLAAKTATTALVTSHARQASAKRRRVAWTGRCRSATLRRSEGRTATRAASMTSARPRPVRATR